MSALTRPASRDDLAWIAPAARAAHLVASHAELEALWAASPWRVRVAGGRDAALLGRWREHLDLCAILGLWAPPARVPALVADLRAVAARHGFGALMGPLVPEEVVGPYMEAGMRVAERIRVMRLDRPGAVAAIAVDGVSVRTATPPDIDAIAAVDTACFEPFWAYDKPSLTRFLTAERAAVAVRDGEVIGYTLAQAGTGEGTLARLAVRPDARGARVGRTLATEAIAWMARSGARAVTVSTQEDNEASAALYRSLGFRDLPGALVAAIARTGEA